MRNQQPIATVRDRSRLRGAARGFGGHLPCLHPSADPFRVGDDMLAHLAEGAGCRADEEAPARAACEEGWPIHAPLMPSPTALRTCRTFSVATRGGAASGDPATGRAAGFRLACLPGGGTRSATRPAVAPWRRRCGWWRCPVEPEAQLARRLPAQSGFTNRPRPIPRRVRGRGASVPLPRRWGRGR